MVEHEGPAGEGGSREGACGGAEDGRTANGRREDLLGGEEKEKAEAEAKAKAEAEAEATAEKETETETVKETGEKEQNEVEL